MWQGKRKSLETLGIVSKEMLFNKYTISKKSTHQIAGELDCPQITILRYLKKYNIPIRSSQEGTKVIMNMPKMKLKLSLLKGGTGIPYELTEYGAGFDNTLKEQVRFRDNYQCQICDCSQLENGRQLDCHHIDYNKKNNILHNLISLCRSCHMKTNINRIYWKELFLKKLIRSIV